MPDLRRTPRFALSVLSGPRAGERFELDAAELVAGRATECGLSIPDPKLSRRHARFSLEPEGLVVEDLESQNGTRVNGRPARRAVLAPGDVVALGATQVRVDEARPRGVDAPLVELLAEDDEGAPRARVVKPVDPGEAPTLATMVAREYFSAIGVAAPGAQAPPGPAGPARVAFLERQTRNFATLYEVSRAVQREHDVDAMLAAVVDMVLDVASAERGYVALLDDAGRLVPRAVRERGGRRAGTDARVALSRTVAHEVLERRCGVIASDAATDRRFAGAESLAAGAVRSLMAAPIVVGNRALGLIELENAADATGGRAREFAEDDLDLLSVVASLVGVALHNLTLAAQRERTIEALRAAQAELLATQEKLIRAEQMAAVGRVASGIAHEVKNHLSPLMLAEMLAQRYPQDRQVRDAAELMLEAQARILDLVNEIRGFAGGASARYEPAPRDVAEVVEGAIRFVQCDAVVKRARVALAEGPRPVANVDAARLRQVLVNLLRNAAEAATSARGARGRVDVRVLDAGDAVAIEVEDNGAGIPPETARRLFEPFFTTKGDGGTGLGLDISRRIVEAHGGTITFATREGAGTTFRVTLPRGAVDDAAGAGGESADDDDTV